MGGSDCGGFNCARVGLSLVADGVGAGLYGVVLEGWTGSGRDGAAEDAVDILTAASSGAEGVFADPAGGTVVSGLTAEVRITSSDPPTELSGSSRGSAGTGSCGVPGSWEELSGDNGNDGLSVVAGGLS